MPKRSDLSVVSLFSGALGLDLGLERAGFKVRVAVDCNRFAADTIALNRPGLPLIRKPLESVTTSEILKAAGLKVGEATVVTGGPSCQAFSTAGHRKSLSDPRGLMFRQFLRVVKEARPRFFVMENVRGVLSAAVSHRPLKKRGPGYPPLAEDERMGSALKLILKELKALNYYVTFDVLNAADFGVPQRRDRIVFIGSRDGEPLHLPKPTHAKGRTKGKSMWVTLRRALKDLKDPNESFSALTPTQKGYLKCIPAGGNWRDLPKDQQSAALGKAFKSWGGRVGFYRRLAWDEPSPALTTRPNSKATMACHPEKLRPLTIRECARLQQFPDSWQFAGGTPQKYIQIGNAVPLGLGEAVGKAIRTTMKSKCKNRHSLRGIIVCENRLLLERLARRPDTVLNPKRMRRLKGKKSAKAWLGKTNRDRSFILKLVLPSAKAIPIRRAA